MLEKIEIFIKIILILYILSQLFLLLHNWFYNLFLPKINLEKDYFYDHKKVKRELLFLGLLFLGVIILYSLPFLAALSIFGAIIILSQLVSLNGVTQKIIKAYALEKS